MLVLLLASVVLPHLTAVTWASGHDWPEVPLYAQSSFYYADYKLPRVKSKPFLPDPPNCPQTGRTVCEELTNYPVEHVLDIVSKAKTNLFNFSSLFVDESENDAEPNFKPPPTYGPPVGKGYVVYQTSLPVLPIHYVNQQNGRYSGAGPRATHRILFPSSTPTTYPSPQSTSVQGRHRIRQESSSYSDPYNLPPPPPPPPPPSAASPSSTWKPMYPLTTSSELTNYGGPSTGSSGSGVKGVQSSVHHRSPSVASSSVPPEEPFRQEKMNTGRLKRQANGNGGNEDEVESICKTQMQFISPKVALNDRAEWKYIVNLGDRDPRLRQIIKVDVCSNANEPCSNQISLPFGFVSRCRQKYIKKKLLSLDPDGQGTSTENFFVPSCCVCEITRASKKKK